MNPNLSLGFQIWGKTRRARRLPDQGSVGRSPWLGMARMALVPSLPGAGRYQWHHLAWPRFQARPAHVGPRPGRTLPLERSHGFDPKLHQQHLSQREHCRHGNRAAPFREVVTLLVAQGALLLCPFQGGRKHPDGVGVWGATFALWSNESLSSDRSNGRAKGATFFRSAHAPLWQKGGVSGRTELQ